MAGDGQVSLGNTVLKSKAKKVRKIEKRNVIAGFAGSTADALTLLERRLDAVIYRAKFATTIFSARQLINHGHVKVNGKKVNISSYSVREEDSIEIRDKSKQLAIIDIALANKEIIKKNFFMTIIVIGTK